MEEPSSLLHHNVTIKWGKSAFTALRGSSINGTFALTRDGWTLRILPGSSHVSVYAQIPIQRIHHADWSHIDGSFLALSTDNGTEIWEPRKQRKLVNFPRGTRYATKVRWSPEDHHLAIAAHAVIVHDTASELEIARFHSHPAAITEMCWSNEGSRIASVDERGNLRIHDLKEQVSHQIRNTGTTIPLGLGWSPDDNFLAFQEVSKRNSPWHIQILDGHTFKEIAQLDHHSVSCLKFSPNGKFLATKSHKNVKLWRTSNWTLASLFEESSDNFVWQELEFEKDRDRLITLGDVGRDLRVWEYSRKLGDTTEVVSAQTNESALVVDATACTDLKSFVPDPTLAASENENILSTIRSMAHVMERSPHAFSNMEEEDLRHHFLVQLNGKFHGNAMGETFNYNGKTDILIRQNGENLFIGECKFWKGPDSLNKAIDQCLSYLHWRDTRAAILLFNRNKDFTNVLSQIEPTASAHPGFKRLAQHPRETEWTFIFSNKDDTNREIHLTILSFDIPQEP